MNGRPVFSFLLCLGLACLIEAGEPEPDGPRCFASPQAAVGEVSALLRAGDFETLASYYELEGSGVDPSTLRSGTFFRGEDLSPDLEDREAPRFRHPFPPGSEYAGHRLVLEPDVFQVEVSCAEDPGSGRPVRRSVSRFFMRKSERGWRLLPGDPRDPVRPLGAPEPPVSYPGGSPFPPGGEPDRTHHVAVFWTTAGGMETRIDVVVPGSRPTQVHCRAFRDGKLTGVRSSIHPDCRHHFLFTALEPESREPDVTLVVEEGCGELVVDVFGFEPEDRARAPEIRARYLLDGRLVGETGIRAVPVPDDGEEGD